MVIFYIERNQRLDIAISFQMILCILLRLRESEIVLDNFLVLLFTIIDGIIFSDWRQKEDAQSFLSSFFVSIIESSFRLHFMLPQIINRSNLIFFFIVYNWKSNTFWIIILVSGKFNLKNNDTLDRYKFAIFFMHVLCWLSHIIFQSM